MNGKCYKENKTGECDKVSLDAWVATLDRFSAPFYRSN